MVSIFLMELVPSNDIGFTTHENLKNKTWSKFTHMVVPGMVNYVGDEERFKDQKFIKFQLMKCFKKQLHQYTKLGRFEKPIVVNDKHSRKVFYCASVVMDGDVPVRGEPMMSFSKKFLNSKCPEKICTSLQEFRKIIDGIYHMFPCAKHEWQREMNHTMVENYHYLCQKYEELSKKYPDRKYFFWIFY